VVNKDVHKRLLSDGPAELQEHVQVEAAAGELARRGGHEQYVADQFRQDDGAGSQAQETHKHRGDDQGRSRSTLRTPV